MGSVQGEGMDRISNRGMVGRWMGESLREERWSLAFSRGSLQHTREPTSHSATEWLHANKTRYRFPFQRRTRRANGCLPGLGYGIGAEKRWRRGKMSVRPTGFQRRSRESSFRVSWNSASLGSIANRQLIPGGNSGYGDLRNSIGSTDGCPTSGRVALVGIATDCSYTASFASAEAVRENIISMVNTASDVYERTFNITIGLQNLTISDAQCPASAAESAPWNVACTEADDIEVKLEQFSEWRGQRNDDNAYWTLMSTCRSGGTVGIAWLGQLCVSNLRGSGQQSVTGSNVVVRTPGEWQVFAHESGHTFGAVHDCDASFCAAGASSQCCPFSQSGCDASGQFLMNPTSSRSMTEFSPCTIGNICSMMGSNVVRSRCLVDNVDVPTINGAQCGNGIVETGEQCDCGSAEECGDNPCCDPGTCQFRGNAVCDDSNEACCSSCQFAAASTVCRASRGPCDLQEVCSGSSGSCPTDAYEPNGQTCGENSNQFCAQGLCTSRDLQCQQVVIQGTSGNYTNSCDDDSCRLRCSQSTNSQFCSQLNRNLLDGTPCMEASATVADARVALHQAAAVATAS